MKSLPGRLLIVLSVVVFAAGACAKKASTPAAAPTSESDVATTEGGGTISVDGKTANYRGTANLMDSKDLELEVKADNYAFSPTIIQGKPGLSGVIGIHNESETLHNFSIDAANVNTDISPGGEEEIHITFPKSGVLVFYCKYHQTSGMRGVLDTTGGKAIDMTGATETSASTSTGETDQAAPSSDSGGNKGY
jgi:plastocyanin